MDYPEINIPENLIPPKTIFYPPVAEVPYLDPLLLPSLEQVESGLGDQEDASEEESSSSKAEELQLKPEQLQTDQLIPKELLSTTDQPIATFNVPFFGEMPIPAPEVIATSVMAAGTASVVSVAGGVAMQAVLTQIKKIFKKIFTKVLKKEVANVKEKMADKEK